MYYGCSCWNQTGEERANWLLHNWDWSFYGMPFQPKWNCVVTRSIGSRLHIAFGLELHSVLFACDNMYSSEPEGKFAIDKYFLSSYRRISKSVQCLWLHFKSSMDMDQPLRKWCRESHDEIISSVISDITHECGRILAGFLIRRIFTLCYPSCWNDASQMGRPFP